MRVPRSVSIAIFLATAALLWLLYHPTLSIPSRALHDQKIGDVDLRSVTDVVQYFGDYPLGPPYRDVFGELGRRGRVLKNWLGQADRAEDPIAKAFLLDAVEQAAASQFPFLTNSPERPLSKTPLADLRSSYQPGSAGIVIATSDNTLRFAAHLIVSLRSVLRSALQIQIAYAGDGDLAPASRALLNDLAGSPPLEWLDVTAIFDDSALQLKTGGWAIKPFVALGSHFERLILVDADDVFLQKPEVLLRHGAFLRTGALLFHDRLLWQHAYPERHTWWKDQIRRPSPALNRSLVWTEEYAEEQDSGVVVLDKRRPGVLFGLLHVCWQNTKVVREEATYRMTYGDKESWWLGLELSGASYEFERHYAAIVGWEEPDRDAEGTSKVCSFVIAHLDEKDDLLWYNGSLLKNKGRSNMTNEYDVPLKWMVGGQWQKGATKQDMSCMVGSDVRHLSDRERRILLRSIDKAIAVDQTIF